MDKGAEEKPQVPTEQQIREAIAEYQAPLTAFLNRQGPYPPYETHTEPLQNLLSSSPQFGRDYNNMIMHDLAAVSVPIAEALSYERARPLISAKTLRPAARARHRIIGSIAQEIFFTPTFVDVGTIVEEVAETALAIQHADELIDRLVFKKQGGQIGIATYVAPDLVAENQEDILFRMIFNAVRNSKKAIDANYENPSQGRIWILGEKRNDAVVISVRDNGPGFSSFFNDLGFIPEEKEISLAEVLESSKGHSGFRRLGLPGTGQGLSIIHRLATLSRARAYIKNPMSQKGAHLEFIL